MSITLLGMMDLSLKEMNSALERIESAVEVFKQREVDVIAQSGVPHVVQGELGYHETIEKRMISRTGIKAITDLGAIIMALNALKAKRIAVVTPFVKQVNQRLAMHLEAAGFSISSLQDHDIPIQNLDKTPPQYIYKLAQRAFEEDTTAQAIYVPCNAWPFSNNIEPLENSLGVPVVYSMQAAIWACLRITGNLCKVEGFGKLLREF